jgi:hypothetical protein
MMYCNVLIVFIALLFFPFPLYCTCFILCRNVHSQLMKHKVEPGLNEDVVVECLRMLAEMVVYGDKKSELLFE